jgi:hypothetical protein
MICHNTYQQHMVWWILFLPLGVTLVVWWLVCLPLDPKVAGLNPAKVMDF